MKLLSILNRKELLTTMDLNKQAQVRGILSADKIPYVTKTTNLQSSPAVGSQRGRVGNFGINQDYSYEYRIDVGKDDYDEALHLIRNIK
jgi:hypothetical protein